MPARCACTCARPPGTRLETDAGVLRRGRGARSASWSAATRSMSCSTTSACPTAASTSRSAIRRPWVRWTARSSISLQREAPSRPPVSSQCCAASCRGASPELQFFFQPADIVDQVLNFGQPAPIDVRISGPRSGRPLRAGRDTSRAPCKRVAGSRRRARVPGSRMRRRLTVDMDRDAGGAGRRHPAGGGQQRAGGHQLERTDGAEFLGRPAQQRQLSAGRAGADLPHRLRRRTCRRCR